MAPDKLDTAPGFPAAPPCGAPKAEVHLPIIVFPPPMESNQMPALAHLFALMVEPQDEGKRAALEEAFHAGALLDCAETGKLTRVWMSRK
jgi:hypothetical protein